MTVSTEKTLKNCLIEHLIYADQTKNFLGTLPWRSFNNSTRYKAQSRTPSPPVSPWHHTTTRPVIDR